MTLEADTLPFHGGMESEVNVEIYVVTGKHGFLRVPESFCRECHLYYRVAERASREADADVSM